VNIQFENVDFNSRSGPNGFGLKLARQFHKNGHDISGKNPDVRLSFIQSSNNFNPTVLRLDGIYFNSSQDWKRMNEPIKRSYDHADAIVVQSEFDKKLIFSFFGERDNVHVIHNGTDIDLISRIKPRNIDRDKTWMCASSWRPHKRLDENIRLFQRLKNDGDHLLVAGKNADVSPDTNIVGVHFLGDLNWETMISCMKSSANFIHLSWLDHCPNVVVDAKAAGCRLHVSEAGGTVELASSSDLVYEDAAFNFEPVELYNPPSMIPEKTRNVTDNNLSLSIVDCANVYSCVLKDIMS
jgi:glycosyltransferase involved in cell wall biosynthesis